MRKRKDIINKKYGKLLVIRQIVSYDDDKINRGVYLCECECGNTIEVKGKMLGWKKGGTNSCGCLISLAKRKFRENGAFLSAYSSHVNHAENKGFIPLSYDVWLTIVEKPCYYCDSIDTKIDHYLKKSKYTTEADFEESKRFINGIDRLNNSIGYELINCVPCCAQCNRMKLNHNQEEFFNKIQLIYNKHFSKTEYSNISLESFLSN